MTDRFSSINEKLLLFVAEESFALITSNSDGVEICFKDLLPVWLQIKRALGYYQGKSFALWNPELKQAFANSERYMLALERLYPLEKNEVRV